jgi:predicted permease
MDFLTRFKEPSTYAALAAAFVALGVALPPGLLETLTQIGTGIAVLLGMFIPEGSKD